MTSNPTITITCDECGREWENIEVGKPIDINQHTCWEEEDKD